MTPDKLAAIRSRISTESAGPWLDCIVAQFALGWKWIHDKDSGNSFFRPENKFIYGAIRDIHGGEIRHLRGLPPSSSDHNACFAALAALEKREVPIVCHYGRYGLISDGGVSHRVTLVRLGVGAQEWYGRDFSSMPLAAARAIALAAVDNGVEVARW